MSIQLAPEIEVGLRAEAAALGISVDALIAKAVTSYLWNAATISRSASAHDRAAEMAWAANPDVQFIGKWVVLRGGQVAASGSDPKQLYEDARAGGDCSPFMIFVSSDEEKPFTGGWID